MWARSVGPSSSHSKIGSAASDKVLDVDLIDPFVESLDLGANGLELLAGRHAVGTRGATRSGLIQQPGDAYLEKLVEILADYGQILDALEEGERGVFSESEHPGLEIEQAELTIQISFGTCHWLCVLVIWGPVIVPERPTRWPGRGSGSPFF